MKIKKSLFSIFNFALVFLGIYFGVTNFLIRDQIVVILSLIFVTNILILIIKSKKSFLRDFLDILTFLTNTLVFLLIINNFVLFTSKVDGSSMEPTIVEDERLYINKFLINVEIDDIVVYKSNPDYIVKRVAGLAGDYIAVKGESNGDFITYYLYINNIKHQNSYGQFYEISIFDTLYDDKFFNEGYQLKENEIFLLGDNAPRSNDSRQMGILDYKYVVGKRIGKRKWIKIIDTNK